MLRDGRAVLRRAHRPAQHRQAPLAQSGGQGGGQEADIIGEEIGSRAPDRKAAEDRIADRANARLAVLGHHQAAHELGRMRREPVRDLAD